VRGYGRPAACGFPSSATSLIGPRVSRAARARGTPPSGSREVSARCPVVRACASVIPTLATCGSVNTIAGHGGRCHSADCRVERVFRCDLLRRRRPCKRIGPGRSHRSGIDAGRAGPHPVVYADAAIRRLGDPGFLEAQSPTFGARPVAINNLSAVNVSSRISCAPRGKLRSRSV